MSHCEVLKKSDFDGETCCDAFFASATPFFAANSGTCYTGDFSRVAPPEPNSAHTVRIWMSLEVDQVPELNYILLGEDVAGRMAVRYVLGQGKEDPKALATVRPEKISPGDITTLGLVKEIVRIR